MVTSEKGTGYNFCKEVCDAATVAKSTAGTIKHSFKRAAWDKVSLII
jgi:hypothetical protein